MKTLDEVFSRDMEETKIKRNKTGWEKEKFKYYSSDNLQHMGGTVSERHNILKDRTEPKFLKIDLLNNTVYI